MGYIIHFEGRPVRVMNPQRIRNCSDGFSQHVPGGIAVSIARPVASSVAVIQRH